MYLCLESLKIDLCRLANSPSCVVSSWMIHCPREHRLLHEFDQTWKKISEAIVAKGHELGRLFTLDCRLAKPRTSIGIGAESVALLFSFQIYAALTK